jgi:hypothetical protein
MEVGSSQGGIIMRKMVAVVLAALVVGLWATPVAAGGWATVTMDEWPVPMQVGERYQLGLTVRQHGVRLVPSNELEGDVVLQLRNPVDGSEETVIAQPSEQPGHYTFELTFSQPGAWIITVKPGWFPESQLSALVVGEAATESATEPVEIDSAMAGRRWARWMGRGLAWASSIVNAILTWNSSPSQAAMADSSIEAGRLLFSAKGCVTCHIHADVTTVWTTESGPNLTHYQVDSAWLAQWLTEPASVRPATEMPNLLLSPDEVVALQAFLLAE